MYYVHSIFLEGTMCTEELDDVDELDLLFSQLQLIEPPPALIARILASVPPPPSPLRSTIQWTGRDSLIVRNEKEA